MSSQLLFAMALMMLIASVPANAQRTSKRPATPPTADEAIEASVPMRDGVPLAADVYLPGGSSVSGRFNTILIRTPYDRKSLASQSYRPFVRHGYALVIEDVRGRYGSKGQFGYISQEGPDGNDTINWIASQRWSNGRVSMAGASFLGITQWWAAVQNNTHLVAISPVNSGDDEYLDRFYSTGGAMRMGQRLWWVAQNLKPRLLKPAAPETYLWHLPLKSSDLAATGLPQPLWRLSLAHPSYDAFWKSQSIREQTKQVRAAVLSFGGWFDNYAESDLDAFARLAQNQQPIETWIGPWGHNTMLKFPTRDFGHNAEVPIRLKQTEWFDKLMKHTPTATVREPNSLEPPAHESASLHLFVMGPDVWREEREWPLARTHYTPLYLQSEGTANTEAGNGGLRFQPVSKSQADSFVYDPKNPAPTAGGSICCDPNVFPPGPLDQRVVERRADVLVYTTPPLVEEMEVTGPVKTVLYVSTSANDTDFTAKLVDVQPDGRPLLVTDGIQRLRYRLSLEKPIMVKRNAAYQITVDTGVTSYVFAAGHRIRLEVSSSNFPRFDRSLNSASPNSDQTRLAKAKQSVYHEKTYPSAVILPVIPREGRLRAASYRSH